VAVPFTAVTPLPGTAGGSPPREGTRRAALSVALGQATLTGRRQRNEDFHGCITPAGEKLASRGICAVVADGMGGALGGMEASQTAVKSLLTDYYTTPDTWSVTEALRRVLVAANAWIHAEGLRNPRLTGMATTLSAVVLKGRHYVTAHVGDSRIYHFRDGHLEQLSTDHVRPMPGTPAALTRALGLDRVVHIESASGELAVGDRLLLVTDGVTGALPDDVLRRLLAAEPDPQTACDRIVQAAFAAPGHDNITAQIVEVIGLPDPGLQDVAEGVGILPWPTKRLAVGEAIDGFHIEELLHQGRESRVYRALDRETGQEVALKFPVGDADDPALRERFVREEWIGLRLRSPHLTRTLRQLPGRRHALYLVMPHVPGVTLARLRERDGNLSPQRVAALGIQLARACAELHRLGITHRDIKPDNVCLTPDGTALLLDLGAARVAGLDDMDPREDGPPGTPSYMAPELLRGAPEHALGDERSDIYALGVTLYHLLTGHYPYGEVEPFSRPLFGAPVPVRRHNPDVPPWLEEIIARATGITPRHRYPKATALLYDLEHPESVIVENRPLLERDPVAFWRGGFWLTAGIALVLLVLLAHK